MRIASIPMQQRTKRAYQLYIAELIKKRDTGNLQGEEGKQALEDINFEIEAAESMVWAIDQMLSKANKSDLKRDVRKTITALFLLLIAFVANAQNNHYPDTTILFHQLEAKYGCTISDFWTYTNECYNDSTKKTVSIYQCTDDANPGAFQKVISPGNPDAIWINIDCTHLYDSSYYQHRKPYWLSFVKWYLNKQEDE